MTVLQALVDQALETPNATAIQFENEVWTYDELLDNSRKIAGYLIEKGFQKNDIVAEFALNSHLFMAVYYGVQLAGLTVMPVNTKLAPPEVDFIFKHSEAKVLIYDEKLQETIDLTTHGFQEILSLSQIKNILNEQSNSPTMPELELEDTSVVMYTSGTTGKPKGVMLSHRNILETAQIWSDSMKMTSEERMFICTPLFHCAGSHVFAVPTIYKGVQFLLKRHFHQTRL